MPRIWGASVNQGSNEGDLALLQRVDSGKVEAKTAEIRAPNGGQTCPTNLPQEFVSPIGPGGLEPPFSDPKYDVLQLNERPVRSGKSS